MHAPSQEEPIPEDSKPTNELTPKKLKMYEEPGLQDKDWTGNK